MKNLNETARDLLAVRQMIRELQSEEEALVDALKAEMVERSTEVLVGDGWSCSWKNINGTRFDSKAFRADHSDLYTAYSRPTITTRFVLTA